jgi:hypothetical protein
MSRRTQIAAWAAAVAVVALVAAQAWQRHQLAQLLVSLDAEAAALALEPQSAASGAALPGDLPPPVARYLKHALPDTSRRIRAARFAQEGVLRTYGNSERWMAFTARHAVAPGAAAFVWDATVALFPLVHLEVRDSLIGGRGAGQVVLLSVAPVGSAGGNREMNSGALQRFLAEAAWYPTALLPGRHLQWTPIDDSRAFATLTRAGISATLEFRFNAANEIAGIYTSGRWGSFDGGYRQVPWEGRFSDYTLREGMRVPTRGEVGWIIDGRWQAVWRGNIVDADYTFE